MQVVIVKEHFFSIGIAILLLMVLYYGVNTIVPPPKEDAFFSKDTPRYMIKSDTHYSPESEKQIEKTKTDYKSAYARYRNIVCSIYLPIGFLTLLIGSFFIRLELLKASFIFGGLFMMIAAIASGWDSYLIRFIASAITLTAVTFVVKRQFANGK